MNIENLKFDEKGLIPVVVQDVDTKKVLMMAYMNEESLSKTIETRKTWFYSRSRQKLWNKGETSGNYQEIINIYYDCDGDTLLIQVRQKGAACHTGAYSCFFNKIIEDKSVKNVGLEGLYKVINDRKENPVEGSYTNYLFDKGLDKILKKVGEEASEVIIGAKNQDKGEIIYEISDLVYHTLVLMVESGIEIKDIKKELAKRQ